MIEISVTGDTYDIRKRLKEQGFGWMSRSKTWVKSIAEASLNKTLEAIRPPRSWSEHPSPKINVMLKSVDINGNELRTEVLRINLKPVSEREGVDFLELFSRTVCGVQVITMSPSPLNTEKKKVENVDEAFF